MGVSTSTARWLAPASFFIDFAAQNYGMLSKPSMLDVHKAHLSFFSPQPFFIAGFFFPQQLFQLAWLVRMWRLDEKKPADRRELAIQTDFVPFYAVGNLCIAAWMIFWNSSELRLSNIFVVINTLSQLYYVTQRIAPMNLNSWSSILTHVVSKTFAGIGVLDILHNTSVAYFQDAAPSTLVKVLTGVGFAGASMFSDWILGGCLAYDLVALSVGQSAIEAQQGYSGWSKLLGGYAVGSAAIVALKNWMRPPYVRDDAAYLVVEDGEE